jgi:hypothetical protein
MANITILNRSESNVVGAWFVAKKTPQGSSAFGEGLIVFSKV